MSILITAATSQEIKPFTDRFPEAKTLITGVGAAVALFKLTTFLCQNKVDRVIQCGIAGAYDEKILGSTVLVSQDCFADLGAEENGKWSSVFEMGFNHPNEFPYQEGWLVNENIDAEGWGVKKAKGITVNAISDHSEKNQMMQDYFKSDIETMEGAALHYVCLSMRIPFVQIRGVSNLIGERNKLNWRIHEAIAGSNALLMRMFENLSK